MSKLTSTELKEIRAALGLTQVEMANATFITERAYQRYESGKNNIPRPYAALVRERYLKNGNQD